jgi:hypothetical protein
MAIYPCLAYFELLAVSYITLLLDGTKSLKVSWNISVSIVRKFVVKWLAHRAWSEHFSLAEIT